MGNLNCTSGKKKESESGRTIYSSVLIKSSTWYRDSHGLFDFETNKLHKKNLKIAGDCNVARLQNDELMIMAPHSKEIYKEGTKGLCSITTHEGEYWIDEAKSKSKGHEQKLFYIVKLFNQGTGEKGYKLKENDIIKLGRMKYIVQEIYKGGDQSENENLTNRTEAERAEEAEIQDMNLNDIDLDLLDSKEGVTEEDEGKDEEGLGTGKPVDILNASVEDKDTCRICFEEAFEDNPLICPCRCLGSVRFIHLDCLRQWLHSKVNTRNTPNTLSYSLKNLQCEICKDNLDVWITHNGKRKEILTIERPEGAYIMLESTQNHNSQNSNSKSIHVIKMVNKFCIRLGRGNDSDVRVSDISVSRCHATIKFIRGEFYLEDNNSKFGTLVEINQAFKLMENSPISIQAERSILTFFLKKPNGLFQSCCGPKGKRVKVVKSEKVNEVKDVNKVSVEEEKKREEVVDIDRGNREMREEVEVDMGVNPRKERENNTS